MTVRTPDSHNRGSHAMIQDATTGHLPAVANDEKVAKVFTVVAEDVRRCLICERLFSPRESFEHSRTICYPPASDAN